MRAYEKNSNVLVCVCLFACVSIHVCLQVVVLSGLEEVEALKNQTEAILLSLESNATSVETQVNTLLSRDDAQDDLLELSVEQIVVTLLGARW